MKTSVYSNMTIRSKKRHCRGFCARNSSFTPEMQAEPCLQWPKGLCRRHETCKFYHAPLNIPALRPGQCSWLKNGAKRCESNATYVENNQPFCFDHTEAVRLAQSSSGEKRPLLAPDRVAKRVSAKSRMVNPYEVGYLVGGEKKTNFDKVDPSLFADSTKPLVVDLGSAQGRFLIQLAQRQSESAPSPYNYVGFELRSGLVNAANETVKNSSLKGSVLFLQGDAKSTMAEALAPVLPATHKETSATSDAPSIPPNTSRAHIAWLTIQFPDPWTKKKHHKRRLVDPTFVTDLAGLMNQREGKVYICSDRYDLASYMYDTFAASALWVPLSAYDEIESNVDAGADVQNTTPAPVGQEPNGRTTIALATAPHLPSTAAPTADEESDSEDAEELAFGADVYREKDLNDTRFWLPRRPFPVGTERDSVAEKKNRPVHRAIFVRRFEA